MTSSPVTNFTNVLSQNGPTFTASMNRNNVLELRTASDFTPEQKAAVDLITIQKDILPVGSIRYEAQKYPADIDIFEQYKVCCSINQVSLNVAQQIQQIAQRVKNRSDAYFSDFKAGFDDRYDINLGEIINNQIIDYNPALIRRDLENLLSQGLLTQTQYNNLIQMVKDNPSLQEFNDLYDELRNLNLLRWSLDELLQGYKILPGNKKIFLDQAVDDNSIVKMDVVVPIDGRYVEVSNWFLLIQETLNGENNYLSEELGDYINGLINDVIKYSSGSDKNTLKAVKRLWNILVQYNDIDTLNLIAPLFSGPISLLYQIRSDIDTLKYIIDTVPNPNYPFILNEIRNFVTRLSPFASSFDPSFYAKLIQLINNSLLSTTPSQLTNNLSLLNDLIIPVIETETVLYLSRINLDPVSYVTSLPPRSNTINKYYENYTDDNPNNPSV